MNKIRLAGVVNESYTDGIGIRYTVFVQGCNHACTNCHNQETWDFKGGSLYKIDDLVTDILENPMLDGVTISGGDPMCQPIETLELIEEIRKGSKLNIWLYTGYLFEYCMKNELLSKVLKQLDVLVDGEYKEELRSLHLRFRGSSNQRIIDVKKTLESGIITILLDN